MTNWVKVLERTVEELRPGWYLFKIWLEFVDAKPWEPAEQRAYFLANTLFPAAKDKLKYFIDHPEEAPEKVREKIEELLKHMSREEAKRLVDRALLHRVVVYYRLVNGDRLWLVYYYVMMPPPEEVGIQAVVHVPVVAWVAILLIAVAAVAFVAWLWLHPEIAKETVAVGYEFVKQISQTPSWIWIAVGLVLAAIAVALLRR